MRQRLVAQPLAQPHEHHARLRLGGAGEVDQELLATPARHEIGAPHRPGDALGEIVQHAVPRRMAEHVVDELEVIEVDERDGSDGRRRVHRLQLIAQPAPVEHPGKRVDARVAAQLAHPLGGRLGRAVDAGKQARRQIVAADPRHGRDLAVLGIVERLCRKMDRRQQGIDAADRDHRSHQRRQRHHHRAGHVQLPGRHRPGDEGQQRQVRPHEANREQPQLQAARKDE